MNKIKQRWVKIDKTRSIYWMIVAFCLVATIALWATYAYEKAFPDPPRAILGDLITNELEWSDNLVLYYTAQDGTDYRMLCRGIFVSGPFSPNDKVPIRLDDVDYLASYNEIKQQTVYSEWTNENGLYPVVHAAQLKKVHGDIILVTRSYVTFQECGLTDGNEADITAYLEEHPLNVQIYLNPEQEHYGTSRVSHMDPPDPPKA